MDKIKDILTAKDPNDVKVPDEHISVYFERSDNSKVLLGKAKNGVEALSLVERFLKEHNYKAPYYRITNGSNAGGEPKSQWIDVGSWSEFFWLVWEE